MPFYLQINVEKFILIKRQELRSKNDILITDSELKS